jgi:hypothetical protein
MPDNLNQMLDAESLASLRQAKEAQRQLRSLGLGGVEPFESTKPKQPTIQDVAIPQKPMTRIAPEITTPPAAAPATQEVKVHDTFLEVENLPSKGLFYRNKMLGQALKVEDLLLIQSIDETNIQSRFDEIFGRRIRDVLPDEILSVDELYISMWLRATSFPGYNFPSNGFVCENENCDFELHDPDYEIPFNQITWDANVLPDEIAAKYEKDGFITIKLNSGREVDLYIGRRFHSSLINEVLKTDFFDKDIDITAEYLDLLRIASVTDIGIADLRGRVEEIKQWDILDFLDLVKAVNNNSLIVEPIVNHICPKCQGVTSLKGYPFRPEIYIPFST